MRATARAHANIALVKYWGKRDTTLNLPAAGSLSLTLDGLNTTTTVAFGDSPGDELWIGGELAGPKPLAKALKVVDIVRRRAGIEDASVRIESANSFPTGAGLASSASGLAALTVAAAGAVGLELKPEVLSRIARVGSGSACRSIFGGFVKWQAGTQMDGADSHAMPVFPQDHWDLRVVVAVVEDKAKAVGSTEGMNRTRDTSPYHQPFLDTVDQDIADATRAIEARDLSALGRVAERSCLRMHCDMMAADPPLFYLKPSTWTVVEEVRRLQADGVPAFFTIDAGPNVKVFCLPEAVERVRESLLGLRCVRRLVSAQPGPGAERVG